MPRLKTQASKDSLLRRMRRQRLRYIAILPSLITLLNGLCGFAAIVLSSQGQFANAGYLILVAMVADMLDGRLARMSHSTSSFGGQLDSLCDVVSFGIAPAFLMVKMLELKLNLAEIHFLERFIWLAAAVYISCAAIRLARFNVENEEDESAHMSFIGLPTPAAAGVIVSLVVFHQESLPTMLERSTRTYAILENGITYLLPFLAFGAGVLMVTRIRYPHIVNQYIKGKKPFAHLIRVLLVLGLIIWSWRTASVVIFCGFAFSGFFKWVYYKFIRKANGLAMTHDQTVAIVSNSTDAVENDNGIQ